MVVQFFCNHSVLLILDGTLLRIVNLYLGNRFYLIYYLCAYAIYFSDKREVITIYRSTVVQEPSNLKVKKYERLRRYQFNGNGQLCTVTNVFVHK